MINLFFEPSSSSEDDVPLSEAEKSSSEKQIFDFLPSFIRIFYLFLISTLS